MSATVAEEIHIFVRTRTRAGGGPTLDCRPRDRGLREVTPLRQGKPSLRNAGELTGGRGAD